MNFIISSLIKLCCGSWIGYNHFISNVTKGSFGHMRATLLIIMIKHVFSCINIRQGPREVLKTEAEGRGFQHLPRDLANVNALKKKNWFGRYYCIKIEIICYISRYFLHYFVSPFH